MTGSEQGSAGWRAAAVALGLACMAWPALAADAKSLPCPQAQGTLAAKPYAAPLAPAATGGSTAPQLATPKIAGLPPKLAPGLPSPGGAGTAKPAYTLDQEAGTVTFGDGQSGQRLPSGTGTAAPAYRTGTGVTGTGGESPCK